MTRFMLALCSAIVYALRLDAFALPTSFQRFDSVLEIENGWVDHNYLNQRVHGHERTHCETKLKFPVHSVIVPRSAHAVKPLKYQDYPVKRQTIIGESL